MIGWTLAYQPGELVEIVRAMISIDGMRDHTAWTQPVTLAALSRHVLSPAGWSKDEMETLAAAFAQLWRHWANEFLDENVRAEYNSFKHGTRALLGGFSVSIAREGSPGVGAPGDNMAWSGGSIFGSSFYTATEIYGKLHRYPRRQSHNWSSTALVAGLELLAISIQNVTSYLRIVGGDDPANCPFQLPEDKDAFTQPFTSPGVTHASFDHTLTANDIERLSRPEIIARLEGSREGS